MNYPVRERFVFDVQEGNYDAVEAHIKRGTRDVHKSVCSGNGIPAPPIIVVSDKGQRAICALLIKCGANVNETTVAGFTALVIASQNA